MEDKNTSSMSAYFYTGEKKGATILKDISEIRFPHLRVISITRNNISTIEGLNRIFLPELKDIFLSTNFVRKVGNKIHRITDLMKTNWPCLNK